MKKILITGGSGFIGSHIGEELGKTDTKVFSLDIRTPDETFGAEHVACDIRDFESLKNTFEKIQPDAVIHLAAIPSVQKSILEPLASMTTNVTGTFHVLEAARLAGVGRIVFASSGAVYGATGAEYSGKLLKEDLPLKPLNPYGLAKKMGEEMMKVWSSEDIWKGPDTVSLRFFNVYGPRQRRDAAYATAIERFLFQWETGEPFTIVPDGKQRRDMVFVKDLVKAIIAAATREEKLKGEVINIGSGKNYSILEIADVIGGKTYARKFIEPRPGEVRETKADITKAKNLLNWEPQVGFEEGIEIIKQTMKKA
jgi:UDP-glucose 4-epimerase